MKLIIASLSICVVLSGALAWRLARRGDSEIFEQLRGFFARQDGDEDSVAGIFFDSAPANAGWPVTVTAYPRLERLQLLRYRDSSGDVPPVNTAADWPRRRDEIVRGMAAGMGALPGKGRRVELGMKVEEEASVGNYVRRLITYQSEPGSRTPAYLCIPRVALERKARVPAVLCLHPTDNQVGHKVVVGLGGRRGRQYAAELAARGYVTISPAYPLLAAYQPDLDKLGWKSGTLKAVWDNTRALDLLEKLPYVDASKGFGAIGHSLGGHNAIFTAVLDKRISVLSSSCGFDAFPDYYAGAEGNWQAGRGWCQARYMPRLAGYRGRLESIPFDFPELLGALAPRPFFVNAPLRDSNFRSSSVDTCAAAARPVYRLLGAPGSLIIRHPDSDHDFPKDMREAAYRVLDSVLRK